MMAAENSGSNVGPVAPDGGWGWVVLLGSFIAYFLNDGWSYSFGALFPSLLENFEEGKGKTSLIAALLYGVPMLLSPVACALTTCYGCRVVMVIGGFLVALSMVLSSFATSVNFLCASLGLFSSVGLSMTYLPALIIVTFYFEKRRGLATGLAVTGSGLGSILFPLFMEYLCNLYTWRGFVLITGALCLHMVACGLIFRPLPSTQKPRKTDEEVGKPLLEDQTGQADNIPQTDSSEQTDAELAILSQSMHVAGRASGSVQIEMEPEYTESCSQTLEDPPEDEAMKQLRDIPDVSIESNKQVSHWKNFGSELYKIGSTMLDKSFAKNGAFVLFCGTNFLLYLWVGVPYIFLIDRAKGLGIPVDWRLYFLSSIIGIGRTVGQIVMGYLGDREGVDCSVLYAVSVVVLGIDTLLVPLCTNYWSLCVFSATYGLFVSVTYAIQMMCVVDIVTLDHATSAFGILQLLQGIATILGTPLAGWLFDVSGGYDPTFYTSGAWMALSGLAMLPLPWLIPNRPQPDSTKNTS